MRRWTKKRMEEAGAAEVHDRDAFRKRYISHSGGVGSHFQMDDVQGR